MRHKQTNPQRSNKHSSFSSSFPIYLFERWTEEVADEEPSNTPEIPGSSEALNAPSTPDEDDEAIVEVAAANDEGKESLLPKVKNVTKEEWSRLNAQPPLWTRLAPRLHQVFRVFTSFRRDPKNVSDGRSLECDKLGINLRIPKRNTTYFTKHFSKISRILWHGITFLVIPALELPSRPSYFYLLDCVSSLLNCYTTHGLTLGCSSGTGTSGKNCQNKSLRTSN